MMDEADFIDTLKAIAHPLRWRILGALVSAERNVGEIEQVTGIGQPALSQQLGMLRKARLVSTRKASKLVYYALARDRVAHVSQALGVLNVSAAMPAATPGTAAAPASHAAAGAANFARMA